MDSDYITYRHGKRIEYPYIDFDEDGNPHIITDNGAILYEYARTVTITDIGTDDDARTGHPTNNGAGHTNTEHREM